MGKVKGKHRLDKFYHLAKEQGYRSRAAFKLIQLDSKYNFLHSSRSVLDLCAAPGGWMQVAVQRVPVGSLVLGIDLFPIRPIRGAISVEEDITKPKCRATIKKILAENGCNSFDLVLHDGSPNVGGAWAQEATSQNSLVIDSVKLATEFLAPKGNFVTKVFRSQDYNAVLYCLREDTFVRCSDLFVLNCDYPPPRGYFMQLFEKVEVTKPAASRSTSAEIFVLGFRYKAPAKVDPRLLDIKHLFQGVTEPQKVIDVLRGGKEKRHRGGYDDGAVLVRKTCSAADFVQSETPLQILGTVTSISFDDPASLPIKNHALTTEEVITLCEDLRVHGKSEFKQLMKWRMNVRKALSSIEKSTSASFDADKEDKDVEEQNEDEKLLNEMQESINADERKKKREKKLLAKRRAKDKARKATGMQVDALQDGYVDTELFSLASVKGKQDLAAIDATEDVEVDEVAMSDDNVDNDADEDTESSDMDSDEERKRYDDQLDGFLDEAYERFVAKRDGSTKQRKRAKRAYTDGELLEARLPLPPPPTEGITIMRPYVVDHHRNVTMRPCVNEIYRNIFMRYIFGHNVASSSQGGANEAGLDEVQPDDDSDKEQIDEEANPLIVPISEERQPTQDEIMCRWFSQDVFAQALEEGDLGKSDSDDDMEIDVHKPRTSPSKTAIRTSQRPSLPGETPKNKPSKVDDDLEVVPAPATDSSDSSSSDDDSEGYDTDMKCETLAFAKKMLSKRKREEIIDDAYNKYMFDDEGLPPWFVDDEKRHYQPIKPITKEEVAAIKAQFKEINARPAKKVAEAKARKKRAAMRKLEKIRKKANSIADQTEIADRSKRRMIEQLYKKATPQKPKKEFVVAKKGVQVKAGKGKVLVDRRMKKDARQHGMSKQAKKGKGKGKSKAKGKGPTKMGKGGKAKARGG
ncbi:hypothetical protein Cgig2_030145 [Carnegiea gigantea]|uniref:Putative rRNA methyltransferase n=1 Tax=Carnegiea gigantea TaxID=171969 RepID=A0A9Q1K171_9CARY|nr:hypothetical protein Cgig2_030145 [Carnegiea gigantea]